MDEHVDALYRVVHAATPSASTQALMLLFHLVVGTTVRESETPETERARLNRFYRALYASLAKQSHVSHGKHSTMFFNLLYRAMKYDPDSCRVNACAKRLMTTALHSNAATVAGSVFLLNEIAKSKPSIKVCVEKVPVGSNSLLVLDDSKREPSAALVISSNRKAGEREIGESIDKEGRSPPAWELSLVSQHYHPSVSKFASTVGDISYAGDPLRDFGLAPFLDKFSYRNPKSTEKVSARFDRRRSVAERRSGIELQIQSRLEVPVNDPKFLEQEHVSEQDEFFFRYFSERARRDEMKETKRTADLSEADDDGELGAESTVLDSSDEADDVDLSSKSVRHLILKSIGIEKNSRSYRLNNTVCTA